MTFRSLILYLLIYPQRFPKGLDASIKNILNGNSKANIKLEKIQSSFFKNEFLLGKRYTNLPPK